MSYLYNLLLRIEWFFNEKKSCGPLSQKENRNVKADWPMDKWPSGLKPSDRFTKFQVQTPLELESGLGTQPCYNVPGDFWVNWLYAVINIG